MRAFRIDLRGFLVRGKARDDAVSSIVGTRRWALELESAVVVDGFLHGRLGNAARVSTTRVGGKLRGKFRRLIAAFDSRAVP